MSATASWQVWALLSAAFAALTALLAKVGVADIDANAATLLRTLVVVAMLCGVVTVAGQWPALAAISPRSGVFLLLSGLATGASWLCYFRALEVGDVAKVAPVDKLSVVLVAVFGVAFLGERLSPAGWFGVAMIAGGAVLLAVKG